jgi:mono/diheme cytochrome c family protein
MPRGTAMVLVLWISLSGSLRGSGQDAASDADSFFESKVRPVLAGHCVECHGPTKASGGLRLDSREGLFQGGDSGPAVTPGDVASSLLAIAIKHDENEFVQMPPKKALPPQVVSDLNAWIAAGAKWPATSTAPIVSDKPHWAFAPLQHVTAPEDPTGWANQPIDRFIAAGQRGKSLAPVRAADKQALLRRAYFDLIGLPPPPEQVEAFLADNRPDAFAYVVEELLASRHYGERWGRHWLDLVRYADTAGDNSDYPIPQAYLYRDYVIDAFNADVPYDRFLHEQLAGDILARQAPQEDYSRLVIATGFIAQAKRIGTRELEDMHLIIEDTLATLGPVTLGLSIRCARCHDHKYDPITQQDYYALYGFFASTQYPFAGAEEVRKQTKFAPLIHPAELKERQARRDVEIARVKAEIDPLEKASEPLSEQLKPLREELARLEKDDCLAGVATAYAVGELAPTDVRLQKNGSPRSTGDVVPRGVPKVLAADGLTIPAGASGRLELARWMTTKASFLTARVMVNRIWQYHFGQPLVATPSDFGFRGTPPTHPELLDWLANEFIASGWSLKAMHRLLMLSRTYQLSSEMDAANAKIDAGNAWHWRFDRRRLDAEALRDTTLALGGTLDLKRPGPHPFPEPATWRFTAHKQFNQVCYPSNHRSVYLMVQRLHAHPYLSLFNGPDASLSTPLRDTSTVPLQALFLLNNELIHKESVGFAQSLIQQERDPVARLRLAFLRAFARSPADAEQARSLAFLEHYEQALMAEGCAADQRELESWSGLARTMMRSNEFFYVD